MWGVAAREGMTSLCPFPILCQCVSSTWLFLTTPFYKKSSKDLFWVLWTALSSSSTVRGARGNLQFTAGQSEAQLDEQRQTATCRGGTVYRWVWVKVAQLCPTLCDPMDYTVHVILQARMLDWVAFPSSRGSSQPRDGTQVSHLAGGFFTSWATREALYQLPSHCFPAFSSSRGSSALQDEFYCPLLKAF